MSVSSDAALSSCLPVLPLPWRWRRSGRGIKEQEADLSPVKGTPGVEAHVVEQLEEEGAEVEAGDEDEEDVQLDDILALGAEVEVPGQQHDDQALKHQDTLEDDLADEGGTRPAEVNSFSSCQAGRSTLLQGPSAPVPGRAAPPTGGCGCWPGR